MPLDPEAACTKTTAAPLPPLSSYHTRTPGSSSSILLFWTMSFAVELVVPTQDQLGECPLWDERAQALWWVDIHGRAIRRFDDQLKTLAMPEAVGSIALRANGG